MNRSNDLLRILPHGADLAMPGEVLCRLLKLDGRQLRYLIMDMRKAGHPILSDDKGYFLPGEDGPKECLRFIRRQMARARSSFHSVRGARQYLGVYDQRSLMELFDDAVSQ